MSTLSGMTGFARVSGTHGATQWTWEARSVNGKGLDVRLRIPSDMSAIDGPVRKLFGARFKRGNIQISLNIQQGGSETKYSINEAWFEELAAFAKTRRRYPKTGHLFQVPGVVSETTASLSDEERAALETALVESAAELVAKLKTHRDEEGRALAPILSEALEHIESLTAKAGKLAALQPASIKDRLQSKLIELLPDNVPEERLAQEAAMLALKADVREEFDRLKAHCEQARTLLTGGSPVGRKLDFLCQEFNRETNTLCSKSSDIDLTQIGLDLKSVVEQFREQAANVE